MQTHCDNTASSLPLSTIAKTRGCVIKRITLFAIPPLARQFGRYPEARMLYVRSLEINPSMGNAHLNIGNIAFRAGHWEEGISRYHRYVSSRAKWLWRQLENTYGCASKLGDVRTNTYMFQELLLRRTIVIRTRDEQKNIYIPLFLLEIVVSNTTPLRKSKHSHHPREVIKPTVPFGDAYPVFTDCRGVKDPTTPTKSLSSA